MRTLVLIGSAATRSIPHATGGKEVVEAPSTAVEGHARDPKLAGQLARCPAWQRARGEAHAFQDDHLAAGGIEQANLRLLQPEFLQPLGELNNERGHLARFANFREPPRGGWRRGGRWRIGSGRDARRRGGLGRGGLPRANRRRRGALLPSPPTLGILRKREHGVLEHDASHDHPALEQRAHAQRGAEGSGAEDFSTVRSEGADAVRVEAAERREHHARDFHRRAERLRETLRDAPLHRVRLDVEVRTEQRQSAHGGKAEGGDEAAAHWGVQGG